MESLSPSQIREINSLYNKMYEPKEELVEVYLNEDEIRSCIAYEIYKLTESHSHYNDEQLSAVVDILTEMNLNIQKAEQAISKIIGEDVSLNETVGVLEEVEQLDEGLVNLAKTGLGYGIKGGRKPFMKFASKQLSKIPFSKVIANVKRPAGTLRKNISKFGAGFVGKMVDDATGKNIQSTAVNALHGIGGALKGAVTGAYRGFKNINPNDKK